MKELTSKKYLCVIRGTEDFLTNDGMPYRGYYLLASDKLASIRAALPDYSMEYACIFTKGKPLASHGVTYNEAGNLVFIRAWRGDPFATTPPASMWVGDTMDDTFNGMLEVAKWNVQDGLAEVEAV